MLLFSLRLTEWYSLWSWARIFMPRVSWLITGCYTSSCTSVVDSEAVQGQSVEDGSRRKELSPVNYKVDLPAGLQPCSRYS